MMFDMGRLVEHVRHPRRKGHAFRLGAATLILIISAIPIEAHSLTSTELEIFRTINELPGAVEPFLNVVMQLGNYFAIPVLAALVYLVTRRWRIGLDIAISGSLAWVLARLVKETIVRGRPADLLSDVVLRGPPATGHGFVSGHSAVAAALATVAAAYLGPRGTAVVTLLAALVAFSRMYVGAHLPLDVIGGAALGWAVGSLVHFLVLPEVLGDEVLDEIEVKHV